MLILFALIGSIGLGKWGSYIGLPGGRIFLFDVLFLTGTFFGLLGIGNRFKGSGFFSIATSLFLITQFIRDITIPVFVSIRDLLPFIYLFAVPACSFALRGISDLTVVKVLRLAAVINCSWFLPSSLGILSPVSVPIISQVPFFIERADQSGIAMGIGVLVWSAYPGLGLKPNYFVISLCVLAAAIGRSRAGLFTTLLALLFLLLSQDKKYITFKKRQRFILLSSVVLVALGVLIASQLTNIAGENSSLARAGILGGSEESTMSGRNTSRARVLAAYSLINWVKESDQQFFGAGPGSEMVAESGAVAFLSGNVEVRSPHNWFIGLYARFGFFGFIFWCALIGQILLLGRDSESQIQKTLRAIVVLICFCSFFGVIMESPFGSLPLAVVLGLYIRRKNFSKK